MLLFFVHLRSQQKRTKSHLQLQANYRRRLHSSMA